MVVSHDMFCLCDVYAVTCGYELVDSVSDDHIDDVDASGVVDATSSRLERRECVEDISRS